ncbi:MAG: CBS domain-containing protein [Fusobacteria bacterium]|nr:CBS domain-containing protein [Fusobacteriota bacterium]
MEIIISHTNLDLDGLASMLLAKKIYPNAKLVLPGNTNKNVNELIVLYQNHFNIHRSKEIDIDKIKKIIIVDTNLPNKLGKFGEIYKKDNVDIIIYDHHNIDKNNPFLKKAKIIHKNYGSNTSLLLEEIINKNGEISLIGHEPTIFMMGIYEDTGSLLYSRTKPIDMKMATFLLEKGASLKIVSEYINKRLEKKQFRVFLELLKQGEILKISLDTIFLSYYESDDFIYGFDVIINKIKDVENVTGAFVVYGNKEKIYIIGRSSSSHINVNKILSVFGGSGHFDAAVAIVKDINITEVYSVLKDKILNDTIIDIRAKDIMQQPVKTIDKELKIKDAYKIMTRFGYNGIPVTENDKLIGIISRRDTDKAIIHGFGNAPVRAYMVTNVFTFYSDSKIDEIKRSMIENNIGRIVIINREKHVIGIVTRTDLLKNIHDFENYNYKKETIFKENIKSKIKSNIDDELLDILKKISYISNVRKEKAYLVGGIVRDIILNIKNSDLDLVVEGDGVSFAIELNKILNGENLVIHDKFKTATINLKNGLNIDIATSRIEFYEYPTSLPVVEYSNIKQDLYRRDFTINAMAIDMSYENFGKLIDYFNGLEDLKNKQIRVLHSLSFIEDPTRIIRAIRFQSRYGFKIELDTEKYILDAINNNFLDKLTWKRVKDEFQLIFSEKNVIESINLLSKYNILLTINKNIKITDELIEKLKLISLNEDVIIHLNIEKWLLYFLLLIDDLNIIEQEKILDKFVFSEKFIKKFIKDKLICDKVVNNLSIKSKNSDIYNNLFSLCDETILIIYFRTDNNILKDNINNFFKKIKNKVNIISGKDLEIIGYKKGPLFKKILDYIFLIQLDEEITEKEILIDILKKEFKI